LTESGLIALRVGLAVGESLDALQVESRIKWPNDIVLCDRKLGGILCEARSTEARGGWIAIGIGINVRGRLPHELADRAICLEAVLPEPSRLDVLDRLVPRLMRLSDAPSLTEPELRAYRSRDWLRGRQVVAPVAGTVVGIAADGTLLVESSGEIKRIRGGTVVPA
jgi:BirA family biotin operon repressor/biotin-[acetyl-CoA-carboxylase] ligase